MSVSATVVTAASSKISSASFKLSIREQKSTKVTYQNLFLVPVAGLTTHIECHTSYAAASTVVHLWTKDANYSLNQLISFQMSYGSFAKLTEELSLFFFGLIISESCYCSHCTLVNGIWFLPLIHLYRVLKLEPCDLEAVLEKRVYSNPR